MVRQQGDPRPVGEPIGLFYAWWRGDPLPDLAPLPGLTIEPADDPDALSALANVAELEPGAIRERMERGHRPYLARLRGEAVACGWSATREASIGELGLAFTMPPGNRYLWDFVTLPPRRGRGIYPRLLQAILRRDREAERFWIGHDLGNVASASGILKAGFVTVGEAYWLESGGVGLVPRGAVERAPTAAALLGIPCLERDQDGAR